MQTIWHLKEDSGIGSTVNMKEIENEGTTTLKGKIIIEDLRSGGVSRKVFEEAYEEFLNKISIEA